MQLVELQGVLKELERHNVGLVGVSYDPLEVSRAFADAKGITFPLLSDAGSRLIESLGLLDRDLAEHHRAFGMPTAEHQYGVAYPSIFLLDNEGRVVQKRIQANYRAREGGLVLLHDALGIVSAARGAPTGGHGPRVRLTARADSDGYLRWQQTTLHVELVVDEGWHVYGKPIPNGYTPLSVKVMSEPDLEVGEPIFPEPHLFVIEGLDEQFQVYDGRLSVTIPVALNVPKDRGLVRLRVNVNYQPCSDTDCLPPATVSVDIPLREIIVQ